MAWMRFSVIYEQIPDGRIDDVISESLMINRKREKKQMIEIHVYGKLRRYIDLLETDENNVVHLSPEPDQTVESLLKRMGIATEDIYTIFLNSKLLVARSGMAVWLKYQQVRGNPFNWDLDIPIDSGDRLGLFGRDMAALVV
ncbi:MAG: hypothetical protein JRI53_07210 [Deltaproteobacteria bacterium]|nr:hypothetical protein [Deltaproteobacteria bacterium]